MKKQLVFIYCLIILFSVIYAKTELIGELKGVNNPEMIVSDGNSIFVLDGIKVKEYDLKTLEFKNSFGKSGNGPGEFKTDFLNKIRIRLVKDTLMLSNFNKIAFFNKSGKFLREIRLPFVASQITPVEKNLLITRFVEGKNGKNKIGVVLYDQNLKHIKTLYTKPEISVERSRRLDAPNEMIFVNYHKKIYIADQKFFKIHIYNIDGIKTDEIKKDLLPTPITEQYKREVYQWFESLWLSRFKSFAESRNLSKSTMKKMIYFHKNFPAFRNLSLIKDGFCIETFIKKGNKSKFYIIDPSKNKERIIWLTDAEPGRIKMATRFTYTINNNFYYYFKENIDNESWELYKEPIL